MKTRARATLIDRMEHALNEAWGKGDTRTLAEAAYTVVKDQEKEIARLRRALFETLVYWVTSNWWQNADSIAELDRVKPFLTAAQLRALNRRLAEGEGP